MRKIGHRFEKTSPDHRASFFTYSPFTQKTGFTAWIQVYLIAELPAKISGNLKTKTLSDQMTTKLWVWDKKLITYQGRYLLPAPVADSTSNITIQEQVQMLINTKPQAWTLDDPHSTIELDIKHKVTFISSVFRLNIGVCAWDNVISSHHIWSLASLQLSEQLLKEVTYLCWPGDMMNVTLQVGTSPVIDCGNKSTIKNLFLRQNRRNLHVYLTI